MATITLPLKNPQELELITAAVKREKSRLEWEIDRIQKKLSIFEQKYKMASQDFIAKYKQGEIGDDEELMEWAGEWDFLKLFQQKLLSLEDLIVECQKLMKQ